MPEHHIDLCRGCLAVGGGVALEGASVEHNLESLFLLF